MIAWTVIKQEIASVVAILGGLAPAQVIWRDEAQGGKWMQEPTVLLSIRALDAQGIEEERLAFVSATAAQTVTVCSQRPFVLTIRAESFEQSISSDKDASNVIDKIRRFRRESVRELITSFAIETYQPIQRLVYKSDGRMVSAAILDIRCRTCDNDIDTLPNAGGWIGEALIRGTVDAEVVSLDVHPPP